MKPLTTRFQALLAALKHRISEREAGRGETNQVINEIRRLGSSVAGKLLPSLDEHARAWRPELPTLDELVSRAAEASELSDDWHIGTEHLLLASVPKENSPWRKLLTALKRYRPRHGWPRPFAGSSYLVERDRPTWDTFLLHSLYNSTIEPASQSLIAPTHSIARKKMIRPLEQPRGGMDEAAPAIRRKLIDFATFHGIVRRIGNVRFYCVECSESELTQLRLIRESQINAFLKQLELYLNSVEPLSLEVICLGGRLDRSKMPHSMGKCLASHGDWAGLTAEDLDLAFIDMRYADQIVRTAIHELSHVAIARVLGGGTISDPINEGFAFAMEGRFAFNMDPYLPDVWPSIQLPERRGLLHSAPDLSACEALDVGGRTQVRPDVAYALSVFLGYLNYPSFALSGILPALAARRHPGSMSPPSHYVSARLGISNYDLNARFEEFCGG